MAGQRISDLTPGTPPYDTASLVEISVPAGAGAYNSRKALLSDIGGTSGGTPNIIPGYLAVGQATAVDPNRARMQITIPPANAQNAIQVNTNDWTFGTTGTSLTIGFGGFTGDTYTSILAMITGNAGYGRLVLQGGNGLLNIGNSSASITSKVTIWAPAATAETLELRTNSFSSGSSGSALKFSFGANSGNTYSMLSAFVAGNAAPGNLVLNATAIGLGAAPLSAGRLQVQAESGNASIAQFQTGDWASGTTGTSLYMGFLAGSGNTNVILNTFNAGNTTPGNLLLNTNGGNVGIGTTTPSSRIHVKAPAGQTTPATFSTNDWTLGSVGSGLQIQFDNTSGNVSSVLQALTTGGNVAGNLALNPSGGTVAIGASPSTVARLQVIAASGSVQPAIFTTSDFTGSAGSSLFIGFGAATGDTHSVIRARTTGITGVGDLVFNPQGGNVGIGTTVAPSARFQVYGGSNTTPVQIVTSDFFLGSTGSTLGLGFGAATGSTYSTLQAFTGGNVSAGNLVINPSGGNVGIGVNPVVPLHIKGSASGVAVVQFTTSDYNYTVAGSRLVMGFVGTTGDTAVYMTAYQGGGNVGGILALNSGVGGNVGIGTSTPNTKLDVKALSGATTVAQFTTNDWTNSFVPNTSLVIGFGAASGTTYTTLNAYQRGNVNSGPLLLNSNGGAVAIGTTTTTLGKLSIQTESGNSTSLFLTNNAYAHGSVGTALSVTFGASSGDTYTSMQAYTAGTNSVGNLALNPSGGNVSIGAAPLSSSTTKLQITGGSNIAQFQNSNWVNASTGTSLYFGFGSSTGNTFSIIQGMTDGNSSAGDIVFYGAGRVGIGTPGAPTQKLDVNGGIISKPPASVTPASNGQLAVEATSNTSLTFRYRGSDGVVRSASLTLA